MLIPIILIGIFVKSGQKSIPPVYDGHDDVGSASIKPSGRLVQKQDRWRLYELHTNVDSLAFTSGHSTGKLVTDLYTLSHLNLISAAFPHLYVQGKNVLNGQIYVIIRLLTYSS